jgi:hypothetical protein
MRRPGPAPVDFLLCVNLGLQVCDGLLTYQGLQLGIAEGNPLVDASIVHWGAGWGLFSVKSVACALLLLLHSLSTHPLTPRALSLTAAWYFAFSFLPWILLLLNS